MSQRRTIDPEDQKRVQEMLGEMLEQFKSEVVPHLSVPDEATAMACMGHRDEETHKLTALVAIHGDYDIEALMEAAQNLSSIEITRRIIGYLIETQGESWMKEQTRLAMGLTDDDDAPTPSIH